VDFLIETKAPWYPHGPGWCRVHVRAMSPWAQQTVSAPTCSRMVRESDLARHLESHAGSEYSAFDQTSDHIQPRAAVVAQTSKWIPAARAFCAIARSALQPCCDESSSCRQTRQIITTITGRFPVPAVCLSIDFTPDSGSDQAASAGLLGDPCLAVEAARLRTHGRHECL